MSNTKTAWLIGGIALAILVIVIGVRGARKAGATTSQLDESLVGPYLALVEQGAYEQAYDQHLTADYRQTMPRDKFVSALQANRAPLGAATGREIRDTRNSYNLFSGTQEYHVYYDLRFANGSRMVWFVLSNADGPFRIAGTYDHRNLIETW